MTPSQARLPQQLIMSRRESIAVDAGFQTTVLPISAGALGRLPAMEVKLKGETAKTNPSSGRYSIGSRRPGDDCGCSRTPRREVHVEAEEVAELAGGVDFGLMRGLGLAEHGGRVDRSRQGPAQQVGGPQEYGRAILPGRAGPLRPGPRRRLDRVRHVRLAALVDGAEDVAVVVRHHGREGGAGAGAPRPRSASGSRPSPTPSRRGGGAATPAPGCPAHRSARARCGRRGWLHGWHLTQTRPDCCG